MHTTTRQMEYLDLINRFIRKRLVGKTFESRFMRMWRADRDGGDGCRSVDRKFSLALDRIFTACDVFVADPTMGINPATDYDEAQLRAFVAEAARPFLDARRTEG